MLTEKLPLALHIICFDVPFPANYGGAMEEFYKIKSLHQLGTKIILHCFVYGDRKPQTELEKYCTKIYYYKRERKIKDVFSTIPFIVKSRMNEELLQNLLLNDFPILLDATHTTGFLNHPSLKERKKIVRLHNIEWIYYRILFDSAINLKQRFFYFNEYKKLRKYDKVLTNATALSCLSNTDFEYYKEKFPHINISLQMVFHPNETLHCKTGNGNYILYHGNLSLTDNYQVIIELLANELKDCTHKIIIAGKNPSTILVDFCKNKPHISLIANPTNEILDELMQNAHICLAIAKNASGIKLKLINSLYQTRFVIANEAAVAGSGLDDLCIIPKNENYLETINTLMQQSFTQQEIEQRKFLLLEKYDNKKNAQQLIHLIQSI